MMLRLAPVAFLLLTAGCVDLTGVNSAATGLVKASSSWNGVAREFAQSCARRQLLSTEVQPDCRYEQNATDGLLAANAILVQYFTALQKASAKEVFQVDNSMASLAGTVGNIANADADKIAATSDLAVFLTSLATNTKQRRLVQQLIDEGAPKARSVIGLLGDGVARESDALDLERCGQDADGLVAANLCQVLANENSVRRSAYRTLLNRPTSRQSANENAVANNIEKYCTQELQPARLSGTSFLLVKDFCHHYAEAQERIAALETYQKSLAKADQILQELQDNGARLSNKEVVRELSGLAQELLADVDAVRAAYSSKEDGR